MQWEKVGDLKIRDQITKERVGVVIVRRSGDDAVEVDMRFGEPEVSFKMTPDIANALADLLMQATAPRN